jgi:hypothetical protein
MEIVREHLARPYLLGSEVLQAVTAIATGYGVRINNDFAVRMAQFHYLNCVGEYSPHIANCDKLGTNYNQFVRFKLLQEDGTPHQTSPKYWSRRKNSVGTFTSWYIYGSSPEYDEQDNVLQKKYGEAIVNTEMYSREIQTSTAGLKDVVEEFVRLTGTSYSVLVY